MTGVQTCALPILPTLSGLEMLDIDDIIRCKGEGSYTSFFLINNRKIMASKGLKEFETLLEGHKFFRIHQTHLVNLRYAEKYIRGRGGTLVMKDGIELEVSRYRKNELLTKLNEVYY